MTFLCFSNSRVPPHSDGNADSALPLSENPQFLHSGWKWAELFHKATQSLKEQQSRSKILQSKNLIGTTCLCRRALLCSYDYCENTVLAWPFSTQSLKSMVRWQLYFELARSREKKCVGGCGFLRCVFLCVCEGVRVCVCEWVCVCE